MNLNFDTIISVSIALQLIVLGCQIFLLCIRKSKLQQEKQTQIKITAKKEEYEHKNIVVCRALDCIHHDLPVLGFQCGKCRTFVSIDGKCEDYVPRARKDGINA